MKYWSYPDPEQCFNIEAYGKNLKEHLSPRLRIRLTSNLVCNFLMIRPTSFSRILLIRIRIRIKELFVTFLNMGLYGIKYFFTGRRP